MTQPLWRGIPLELPAVNLAEGDAPVVSTIQLARVGRWEHPVYGPFEFDEPRFERFIANFNANVRRTELALDVEHIPQDGAAAWFTPLGMRMAPTPLGTGLFQDVKWTPRGLQLVRDEEYKYCSLTFKPEWTDPEIGKTYQDVVFGAALTTDPFIKGMQAVQEGLVMLSEFVEMSGDGNDSERSQKMAQSAESMRTDDFVNQKTGKKPEELADTDQQCPICQGSGKIDGTKCRECNGTGQIPEKTDSLAEKPGKGKGKKAEPDEDDIEDDAPADLDDVEAMAEDFHQRGKALCDKLAGRTGAPMVRQHMAATAKLMEPIIKRAKGDKTEMADTSTTPIQLADHPEVKKLADRLQEVERQRERDAIELGRLREDKRKNEVVKLSEGWFPRAGEEGFRFKSGDRMKLTDFMLELSGIDERENERLVKLSEGAALAEDRKSRMLARFSELVNAIPEPRLLNLSSHIKNSGEEEDTVNLSDSDRLALETRKLAEKENIPICQAARKVAAHKR